MADVTSEYAAANGWREIDLSGELWRAYCYSDGSAMRISDPARVFKGWSSLQWKMRDGQPAFVA